MDAQAQGPKNDWSECYALRNFRMSAVAMQQTDMLLFLTNTCTATVCLIFVVINVNSEPRNLLSYLSS